MTRTDIAKRVVSTTVSIGVSRIVVGIVAKNASSRHIVDDVAITAASLTISAMIQQKTRAFTDDFVDGTIAWYNENVKK